MQEYSVGSLSVINKEKTMENILENEFEEEKEKIDYDNFIFEAGQIFEGEYPPQAAQWCNENNCYIEEIEPLEDGTRRFEIKEIPKPTEEEIRQRLDMMTLTAADVERAIYKAKGMDFDDIIEFVKSNPPEGLDIKALKIELKANNFYRGNPYVEQIGMLLGNNSDDLDYLFQNKELPEKND